MTIRTIPGAASGARAAITHGAAGADVRAMGGYRRSPWREAICGGATRDLLASNTLALLPVH
jgi:hypothetical protein